MCGMCAYSYVYTHTTRAYAVAGLRGSRLSPKFYDIYKKPQRSSPGGGGSNSTKKRNVEMSYTYGKI